MTALLRALVSVGSITPGSLSAQARGVAVGGGTWARFMDWPNRVLVTEFDIGRRTPQRAGFAPDRALRRYRLPMLRGPIGAGEVRGQLFEATLRVPADGDYEIALKTQSGRASLLVDFDGSGSWSREERLIGDTPPTEQWIRCRATLRSDRRYALRVDHASGLPRPVLMATLRGPAVGERRDLSEFLLPLSAGGSGRDAGDSR